jgi:hypothetical protein
VRYRVYALVNATLIDGHWYSADSKYRRRDLPGARTRLRLAKLYYDQLVHHGKHHTQAVVIESTGFGHTHFK